MQHGGGAMAPQDGFDAAAVADVALFERPPFHRPAVTGRQVVVDDRQEARPGERLADMAADIAGAAGDQDGRFAGFFGCAQAVLPRLEYWKPAACISAGR